jgi:putative tricarboxylic transport membrane protein
VYALVLGVLGYVIATGLMIPSGARILGSRRLVRDAAIGFALAIVVYVAFTNFLGVRLPAGVLEPVLP